MRGALWSVGAVLLCAVLAAALVTPLVRASDPAPAARPGAAVPEAPVVGGRGADWPSWGISGDEPLPEPLTQSVAGPAARAERRVAELRTHGGTPVVRLTARDPVGAVRIVRENPEVRHVVVVGQPGWDPERYTRAYNSVYRAVKQANPGVRVGGPSVEMVSEPPGTPVMAEVYGPWGSLDPRALQSVRYWLSHRAGADFVAVTGSAVPRRAASGPGADVFVASRKFTAVTQWLSAQSDGRLPVWWDAWDVGPPASSPTGRPVPRETAETAALIRFVRGGAVSGLYRWQGRTAPAPVRAFDRWFPPGTPLVKAVSSDPRITVLAQPARTVAVNTTDIRITTTIEGRRLALGPYEVLWQDR